MASVKKNFLYNSAYQILTMILPLVTSPYVARVLGADGIGINSYTYSIVYYFVLFAKLGLQNYGNRTIAIVRNDKKKLNQTFSDLYALHAIITLVVMAAYLGYVTAFGGQYKLIFLLQGGYLIGQLLDISWFFFGIEEFKVTVMRNTIIKVLVVVCTLLFVKDANDIWIYAAILAFGSAIGDSSVWLNIKRYVTFVKPDLRSFGTHFKGMLIYFIPATAVSLYKVLDKIMLGAMAGTVQTGLFENSEKIINICLGLVTALGTVMMPRMTNLIARGKKEEGQKLIRQATDLSYVASFAMAFGIIGVANVFSTVFWGEEFASCGGLMSVLALSVIFSAIANVIRSQLLIPQGMEKLYISSVCFGAVVNLVVNMIFIPKWQAAGAVLGTVAAEGTVFAIQMFFTRKEMPHGKLLLKNIYFAFLGLAMCILCRLIGDRLGASISTLILQVASGSVFYITGALLFWKLTGQREYLAAIGNMFKKVIRR